MVCFRNYLVLEGLKNVYDSCILDVLIEKTCRESLKIILETDEFDDDLPYLGDLEDDKFAGSEDAPPIKGTEQEPDPEPQDDAAHAKTMRSLQKQLRDAILVLRWDAVDKRAQDIEKLKYLRDQYIQSYGNPFEKRVSESADDDDDSDFVQAMSKHQNKFNVMQAVPLLEKLGYIDVDDLRREGLDDEEISKAVTSALFKASDEKGNELPPDVEGLLDKTDIKAATKQFFLLTREIFKTTFKRITKSSRNSEFVKSGEGTKRGYRLYDPGEDGNSAIDDISNQFAVKMMDVFTKRNVSKQSGKPEPWMTLGGHKNFGKDGLSELDDEQFVGDIISYIRNHLKQFYSNQEREMKLANSPAAPTQDIDVWGGNRDKKASLIKIDIEKNNLDFYKKYMSANDQERSAMDANLRQLEAKKEKLTDEEREEKWRLEILQQIFFLHSKYSDSLSLNPSQVASTLQFYRSNFLGKKYRAQSFFGSMGRKTDSGEMEGGVDLGFGTDSTAKAGDSGSNRDRGQSSFPNPAAAAMDSERNKIIHSKLIAALNDLRIKDPNKALAICVFWELGGPNGCSLGSAITNVDAFSNLIIAKTQQGEPIAADSGSCEDMLFKQLRAPSNIGRNKGKSIEQANDELNAILGTQISGSTFRNWLSGAIKHICEYIKKSAHIADEPEVYGAKKPTLASFAPTASTAQSRKFDATRLSPLSSRLRTPKVTTDSETGRKTYEPNS